MQHLWGVTCLSKGVRAAGLMVQLHHQKPALCLGVFRRAGSRPLCVTTMFQALASLADEVARLTHSSCCMQPMQASQLGTICTAEGTAHISSLGCGADLAEEADWELLAAGCQNVRNRNIIILARMDVKIKSLTLGHAGSAVHGKPRITNQVHLGGVRQLFSCQGATPVLASAEVWLS